MAGRTSWSGGNVTRAIAWVVARDHGICIICGHHGANSLDHIVPVIDAPELEWETTNWKAAHQHHAGHTKGCPTPGCRCPGNVGRGAVPLRTIIAVTRDLTCTCDCTCGARLNLDQLIAPTGPPRNWLRNRPPASPAQIKAYTEEQNYSEEEAARAATAWRSGDRSDWAVIGYNVHLRRYQRVRRGESPSRDW